MPGCRGLRQVARVAILTCFVIFNGFPLSRFIFYFTAHLKHYLIFLTIFLMFCFFYRNVGSIGCEKIENRFCICFVEDLTETDISTINQAIKVYRGESSRDGAFILMRDRELLIITEFFARYGSYLKN